MNPLSTLITGLKSLLNKPHIDRELDEELDTWIEASAREKEHSGLTPQVARREALKELGSRTTVKHQIWASRWESTLDNALQDIRLGIRALAKSPGFTAVALLSLALGIGANTSIFTLLNAILLRPLPVPHPEQLILFGDGAAVGSIGGLPNRSWQLFSYPFFHEFRSKSHEFQSHAFQDIAATHSVNANTHLSISASIPEPVHINLVSGNYFSVLEVHTVLGRPISEEDDKAPGAGTVVVASYTWFQHHVSGNPVAIGKALNIEGKNYTLIGVAQPGYVGAQVDQPAHLFVPLSMEKELFPGWNGLDDKFFQTLFLIARLKPSASPSEAMAQATPAVNLLFKQILRSDYVGANPSRKEIEDIQHASIELTSAANGLSRLRYFYSLPLKILMVIVALVLLIACANIANMLLARGVARAREVALRMALGASRSRIILQLFTESALLSFLGASLGIAIAWQAAPLLLRMSIPGPHPVVPIELKPDLLVLAFTLLVTVLTALLFGIAPAFRATQLESVGGLTPALKEGRGGGTASTRSPLARGLIVGQIALSVLLLAAAGLFLRSLLNLTSIDTGFDAKNVLVFSLDESSDSIPSAVTEPARLIQLQQQIESRVASLPGVVSDGFSSFTFDQGMDADAAIAQGVPRNPENSHHVLYNRVGQGFLQTLGLPLRSGRGFSAQDTLTSPKVAVINETMQRVFFPGQSAIGRHFGVGEDPAHSGDIEIIGVVKDARYVGLGERQRMAAYFPYTQQVQTFSNFSVRYTGDKTPVISAIRQTLAEINPNILIPNVYSLEDQVAGSIATQSLIATLSAFFGILAVFLACLGIYGLMSYSVLRRTNEIGIRLALGAQTPTLLWMILRESIILLAIGLAAGLPIAYASTGILTKLLYELSPTDPSTFVACAAIVAVMTVAAAWLPARRATKVDPIVALRCD
jgi:predicted permease